MKILNQPSWYLSMEASQARILALLDRIENEMIYEHPTRESDYHKLPRSLQQEIERRLLTNG